MKTITFHKQFFLSCALSLFAALVPQQAAAQGDGKAAHYEGKGMDIAEVQYTSFTDATRVLLYNVGKDMFLKPGGFWGTRTSTYTIGMPLVLEQINGDGATNGYYIRGPYVTGDNVDVMALVMDTDDEKRGIFFDRVETGTAGNTGKETWNWKFEEIENTQEKGPVYHIKIGDYTNDGTTYYLCSNELMTVKVFNKTNQNLVKARTEAELKAKYPGMELKDMKDIQWQLVSNDEIVEQFATTYTKTDPVDASFLLRAQSFSPKNLYNTFQPTYGNRGWQTSGTTDFKYKTSFQDEFGTDEFVYNGNTYTADIANDAEIMPNFGMYCSADLKDGSKGDKLYQTVELTKNGWYMVQCQGFYRDYETATPETKKASYASLYAKIEGSTYSAGSASVPLLPRSFGETQELLGKLDFNATTFKELTYKRRNPYDTSKILTNPDGTPQFQTAYLYDEIEDGMISNKVEAGVAFYVGIYPNSVLVYVNGIDEEKNEKKTLELGIEITGDMVPYDIDSRTGDYVYVDDFRLYYHGESFALNEGWSDFTMSGTGNNVDDKETTYQNRVMILKRSLTPGLTNSLCLPVDLTKEQVTAAFGGNVMLARLCDGKAGSVGTIAFDVLNLDKFVDDDIVIRSGECYLIKPIGGNYIEEGDIDMGIEIGDISNTKIQAPYYIIPRVSLKKDDVLNGVMNGKNLNKFSELRYNEQGEVDNSDHVFSIQGAGYENCKLSVYGTFQNGATAPKAAYTFYNSTLYHLTGEYQQPGYSWWIEDAHQHGSNAKWHSLAFTTYNDGIGDVVTSVDGIFGGVTMGEAPAMVCNIFGQVVRRGTTSLSGLPSGMYIVNGRKVAVR